MERLCRRRGYPKNMVQLQYARQVGLVSLPVSYTQLCITNLTPNCTILNVQKPDSHLKRFSSNGRYLVGFNCDLRRLDIFVYEGFEQAYSTLRGGEPCRARSDSECESPEEVSSQASAPNQSTGRNGQRLALQNDAVCFEAGTEKNNTVRQRVLETILTQRRSVSLCMGANERLVREFLVFDSTSQHALVASVQPDSEDAFNARPFNEIYQSNESLFTLHAASNQQSSRIFAGQQSPLEKYTLFVVQLSSARQTDAVQFRHDRFNLAFNQCVSLCGSRLALLSTHNQLVHVFELDSESGTLQKLAEIGLACFDDEQMLVRANYVLSTTPFDRAMNPYIACYDKHLTTLKQRLLSALFREACRIDQLNERRAKDARACSNVAKFLSHFDELRALRLSRAAFLDDRFMLLRYGLDDAMTQSQSGRAPSSTSGSSGEHLPFTVFAIYDTRSTEIVRVFENTSIEFALLCEAFTDKLRYPIPTDRNLAPDSKPLLTMKPASSAANTVYARKFYERMRLFVEAELRSGNSSTRDSARLFASNSCFLSAICADVNYSLRGDDDTPRSAAPSGSVTLETVKRLLANVPPCCQLHIASPYVDHALFAFEEKQVGAYDRPRVMQDALVRFYARTTGALSFALFLMRHPPPVFVQPLANAAARVYARPANNEEELSANAAASTGVISNEVHRSNEKQWVSNTQLSVFQQLCFFFTALFCCSVLLVQVSFIFHPFEPFVISVQRPGAQQYDYYLNLHLHYRPQRDDPVSNSSPLSSHSSSPSVDDPTGR